MSKIVETLPDWLHLKWDFQNSLWNFSGSNIEKVTDKASLIGLGPPKTLLDGQKRQKS